MLLYLLSLRSEITLFMFNDVPVQFKATESSFGQRQREIDQRLTTAHMKILRWEISLVFCYLRTR